MVNARINPPTSEWWVKHIRGTIIIAMVVFVGGEILGWALTKLFD